MGQLHDSTDSSSWTATAFEAVQDIAAALQAGRDDIQPMDDAPSYQVGAQHHHSNNMHRQTGLGRP